MAIGAAVIIVTLLSMWLGGSDDKASNADELAESHGLDQPLDTGLVQTKSPDSASKSKSGSNPLVAGATDPFANAAGGDHKLHKVTIRFSADGGMYAGYRYRSKGGEGLKVANKFLEVSKTVRGPLPVAQAAVQVMQTSTYATCTILVDGVAVTTETAKGPNHVTVCTG